MYLNMAPHDKYCMFVCFFVSEKIVVKDIKVLSWLVQTIQGENSALGTIITELNGVELSEMYIKMKKWGGCVGGPIRNCSMATAEPTQLQSPLCPKAPRILCHLIQ